MGLWFFKIYFKIIKFKIFISNVGIIKKIFISLYPKKIDYVKNKIKREY
jgi:hypothetical protein